ncbi:inositol monophosphatase family protein [Halapricum desulfuricans]|uniref:Archaeal fructose-1,6-bisphosphatase or related enzyme of inositol monophosphatase family n=1 Tax=Halapricum desulfuricans TaxID=2841257 RepID=A0A897NBE8_9EURY|nr:inositol monophosphatase family protein [Halapricum desulfuricans]QSG09754.1 Archaeal fructose-1,6-bisphosphatase or related enzyme of inositol monophosphatase family [Halapricum desulfuricans]
MDYERELDAAIRAASAGMAAIADWRGDGTEAGGTDLRDAGETETKTSVNDMVTAADQASQDAILEILTSAFPDDSVVGEEGTGEHYSGHGREWVVDPIDGTANFAVGLPYYCVSIALVVDGTPQVGVVASPPRALDRLWYGVRGEGAFVHHGVDDVTDAADLDGTPLAVSDRDELAGAVVFGRLSERDADVRAVDEITVREVLDREGQFRRPGSAAINLAQVAAGHADGYLILSIQEWDVAAGLLLVEEAGGTVRRRPSRIEDSSIEVIVSNGYIQADLEAIAAEAIEQAET